MSKKAKILQMADKNFNSNDVIIQQINKEYQMREGLREQ